MNYTKGKWEAGYNPRVTGPTTPNVSGPCCGGSDWPYRTVNVGTETIAIVPAQDTDRTHNPTLKEAEANAQLIASAPDLYEALKVAEKELIYTSETRGIVVAALTKAEGK